MGLRSWHGAPFLLWAQEIDFQAPAQGFLLVWAATLCPFSEERAGVSLRVQNTHSVSKHISHLLRTGSTNSSKSLPGLSSGLYRWGGSTVDRIKWFLFQNSFKDLHPISWPSQEYRMWVCKDMVGHGDVLEGSNALEGRVDWDGVEA